jgi:hypothetical protein
VKTTIDRGMLLLKLKLATAMTRKSHSPELSTRLSSS